MTFLIYLVLGLITILPWLPKRVVRYADKEWLSLPWEPYDTFVLVIVTLFAVVIWPGVLGGLVIYYVTFKLVHRPLVKMFERERQTRLSKEKDNG